ncbi:MAG: hypothetical protein ACI4PO_09125 [Faecousia sp.]
MAASQQSPVYTVYFISGDTKYNVTPALVALDRSDSEGKIAQRVNLQLMNVKVNGIWLSGIITAGGRVIVYANDGSINDEVFRGYPWTRKYVSSLSDHELSITCYDNLIYFQESEESLYFTGGKNTEVIVSTICERWGVPLKYKYDKTIHAKLPLRGKLYDIITTDLLDVVKKRTGNKYVVLSDKDTMYVKYVGANTTIYHFQVGKNITRTTSGWTMEGVVTKVVIVGKADDEDRVPIEATVTGNTSEYGTLQKIQQRDENTDLVHAKLEAQNTIDEKGEPKWEYEIKAPDIPWIRKGDKVYVDAGDIVKRYLIVIAVDRTFSNSKSEMTLTLENE